MQCIGLSCGSCEDKSVGRAYYVFTLSYSISKIISFISNKSSSRFIGFGTMYVFGMLVNLFNSFWRLSVVIIIILIGFGPILCTASIILSLLVGGNDVVVITMLTLNLMHISNANSKLEVTCKTALGMLKSTNLKRMSLVISSLSTISIDIGM